MTEKFNPNSRTILVCQGRTCSLSNSAQVLVAFQVNSPPEVKIIGCGCLGQCGNGPMVLILPEETWYSGVSCEAVTLIIEQHLCGGKPIVSMLHSKFHLLPRSHLETTSDFSNLKQRCTKLCGVNEPGALTLKGTAAPSGRALQAHKDTPSDQVSSPSGQTPRRRQSQGNADQEREPRTRSWASRAPREGEKRNSELNNGRLPSYKTKQTANYFFSWLIASIIIFALVVTLIWILSLKQFYS